MTVFAVISTMPDSELGNRVATVYGSDSFTLSPDTWFVAEKDVTTAQVCEKLGIGPKGLSGVVVRFDGYFGYGSNAIWEWLRLKGANP
jgi:hypothetical protein